MAAIRLQKLIAQAGLASRREAEEWIREGLVTINGQVATVGQSADLENDAIKVKGKLLHRLEEKVYYAFYKPRGVVCTLSDPQGRATLSEYLGSIKEKVYPVGRLDFTTEGLLLLTNDGTWAEKVQKHPEIVRVYQVKVKGTPGEIEIDRVRRGGQVEGRLVIPYSVKRVEDFSKKSRIELSFQGPVSADLKSFLDHKGLLSERLMRVAIGQIAIKGMEPGEVKKLRATQAMALVDQPYLGLREPEKARDLSVAVRPYEIAEVQEKKRVIMRDIYRSKRIGPKLLARRKSENGSAHSSTGSAPVVIKRAGPSSRVRSNEDTSFQRSYGSQTRPKIIPQKELEKQYFVATYGEAKPSGFPKRDSKRPRFDRGPSVNSGPRVSRGPGAARSFDGPKKSFGERKPSRFGASRYSDEGRGRDSGNERRPSRGDGRPSRFGRSSGSSPGKFPRASSRGPVAKSGRSSSGTKIVIKPISRS